MNPEIAQYEALAKDLLRRCMAEEDPADLYKWLTETLARLGGGDDSAVLGWVQSFDFYDALLAKREQIAATPLAERKVLDWPWGSWNKLIDPLEPGMLATLSAPDGMGKTTYGESIAEHWARRKNRIAFVHYELNRVLMMDRRTARHTGLTARELKSGSLTPAQRSLIADVRPRLLKWDGYISYIHTPGWSMERTVAELRKLVGEGECDAVVIDYLEKAAASQRQLRMFGSNAFQREADNVEQLKNFAESTEIPVLMVAQMSKAGKSQSFENMDRTGMRGAGEKSEKANLVVLLHRERTENGYSNIVDVMVDKNTMGPTGAFRQMMQPELYRVGDIAPEDASADNT